MFGLLLLAIVQIIVEVLPISSSGHMRLAALLAAALGHPLPEPPQYFDEFLHGFTLVAVLIFFRKVWVPVLVRLWQMLRQRGVLRDSQKKLLQLLTRVCGWVLVTTLITVAGYFCIKLSGVEAALAHPLFLALGFAGTAVGLLLCPLFQAKRWQGGFAKTLIITLAQVLACLLPGVSRFGTTAVIAIALGITPRRAVQWSWLIFMPLMLGASVVHGVGKFVLAGHNYFVFKPLFFGGCVLATCLSYALFAGVVWLFQTKRSWVLGLYMLIPIVLLFLVN